MRDGIGRSEGRAGSGDLRRSGFEYPAAKHTEVHDKGSRWIELLQDLVVVLLAITLLGLALMFLWRVWQEIVVMGNLQQAISDIIYVFITVELYRLSVNYLRYHRVDVDTLVEVGVAAIIQKMILVGVDKFTMDQLVGISLVLLVLGLIMWMYLREGRYGKPRASSGAEGGTDPVPALPESREDQHVVGSTEDNRKPTRSR